jgi:hypothetical protein
MLIAIGTVSMRVGALMTSGLMRVYANVDDFEVGLLLIIIPVPALVLGLLFHRLRSRRNGLCAVCGMMYLPAAVVLYGFGFGLLNERISPNWSAMLVSLALGMVLCYVSIVAASGIISVQDDVIAARLSRITIISSVRVLLFAVGVLLCLAGVGVGCTEELLPGLFLASLAVAAFATALGLQQRLVAIQAAIH